MICVLLLDGIYFMKKSLFIGGAFIALAIVSFFIQNTYYGYVDAEGVLRDSIFLPLGVLSGLIGVALIVVALVLWVFRKYVH